jgi:thymidine phosphorylase
VGVVLAAKVGERVERGQTLCTIHAQDDESARAAEERMLAAYGWSDEPVSSPPPILDILRETGQG